MKKIIALLLCLVMCFALVACNSGNEVKEDIEVAGDGASPFEDMETPIDKAKEKMEKKIEEEKAKKEAESTENGVITSDTVPFVFPFNTSLSLVCTSGAGAWSDDLTLSPDGQFFGAYHDTDAGDTGEGYPNGTHYYCEYWGFVSDVEQTSDYSYACKIQGVGTQNVPGTEDIEEGILFKYTKPESLVNENEFVLYLPNTPVSVLPEGAKSWLVPLHGEFKEDTIGIYVFYSLSDERTYWTYPNR